MKTHPVVYYAANAAAIIVLNFILLTVIVLQLWIHELPCPLCFLQRLGLELMLIGFLMNCLFGNKTAHFGLIILAALYSSGVAIRQILLHIAPGSGIYGTPIFGISLYTWVFIIAAGVLGYVALNLLLSPREPNSVKPYRKFTHALFTITLLVLISNAVLGLLECGLHQCPDNPTVYRLLTNAT